MKTTTTLPTMLANMNRRNFITAAIAGTVLYRGGLAFGFDFNDVDNVGNKHVPTLKSNLKSGPVRRAPVFISHKSFSNKSNTPSSLAETIRKCRDEWKFDGFELSLSAITQDSKGKSLPSFMEEFQQYLIKIEQVPGKGDFAIFLSVDLNAPENTLEFANQVLKVTSAVGCSVSLPEHLTPENFPGQIIDWCTTICAESSTPSPFLMLETPSVFAGMQFNRLAKLIEDVPSDVGVLIRSDLTHYRFDLGVQDLEAALKQDKDSNNFNRPLAARIHINSNMNQPPNQVALEREIFHRAIVEHLAPKANTEKKPLFVSVESSISFDATATSPKLEVGNRLFTDLVDSIGEDLLP